MPGEAAKSQLTPERWQQIRDLLAVLMELPEQDRSGFLDNACPDDTDLRVTVEDLLRAHESTGAVSLDQAPTTSISAAVGDRLRSSMIGRRIGVYRIEAEIAHGGMGTVYRAARVDQEYEKQVAIKLVARSVLSRRSAELFRHERQILASLEHPNIARLLDGGTTEDGSPYLVMEYVEGEAITTYCDAHQLAIEARLRLFQKICSTVHFAHQNLVIHRDIKPANILVTVAGEPKLLDFGIAKIIDGEAANGNQTQTFGAMTPAYASPEQLNGQSITTATDTYSLGMILYELLTGRYAYERFTSPARRQQAILEDDPEPPSQAVLRESLKCEHDISSEQIGALRGLPVEKLSRRLAGDIESIVAKAIRKEPELRYSSVAQFSEDISRHLRGETVIAHGNTLIYRATKFVRRHKLGVVSALLVFALFMTGIAMIVRAERKAKAEQAVAERRFNDVRKLANSLIFEIHDSIQNLPGATAARKLIVQRAQEYLDGLAGDSKSDPELLREMAAAYIRLGDVLGDTHGANIGDSEQALRNYRRAAHLREMALAKSPADPANRSDLASSYVFLDLALERTGNNKEAKEFMDKAMAILEPLATSEPGNPKVQFALAKALEIRAGSLSTQGQWADATANYERSLTIYEQLVEKYPDQPRYRLEVAFGHKHLGAILIVQKQLQAALEQYRSGLAIEEAQLKADPLNASARYNISMTYSDMGYILRMRGDLDGALAYYHKALDIRSALASADPQDTRVRTGLAGTYTYIAQLLWKKKDLQRSLEAHEQALQIRQALAQSDPASKDKQFSLAGSEMNVGEAHVEMAFQPHTTKQQQLALCQQAEFWIQKALPAYREHKFVGLEIGNLEFAQREADRCNHVISRLKSAARSSVNIP